MFEARRIDRRDRILVHQWAVRGAKPGSLGQRRQIHCGRATAGRALFVAFTLRRKGSQIHVRPVSARYMHRKEIEAYEKESS